eukprot:scaffold45647_cov90-Phaeocystis_antarctica.AAC.1
MGHQPWPWPTIHIYVSLHNNTQLHTGYDGPQTCCMWTVNKKRHSGGCATRFSAAWRWPARSQKCQTPSALPFPDHWSTGSTWVSSSAT